MEPRPYSGIDLTKNSHWRDEVLQNDLDTLGQTTGVILTVGYFLAVPDAPCFAGPNDLTNGRRMEIGEVFIALSEGEQGHGRIYWDALYEEEVGIVWVCVPNVVKRLAEFP